MDILCIILFIIILSGITYYIINRKKLQQHIKESYLKENREKLIQQINTEKQSIEDGLLLETRRLQAQTQELRTEKERLALAITAGEQIIEQLEKRKQEQEQSIIRENKLLIAKEKERLDSVRVLVDEKKKGVQVEVDAFREVEMQKARTAVDADAQAEQKWAETTLSTYWDGLAQTTQEVEEELARVLAELADYKKKQQAVNEAILRQRAIDEQQDFYRVCLSQETIEDVQILQNVRQKLHFSESLNKLIYDVYISKPAKEMIKRVLGTSDPSGVYKITRLKTGEVYIGQAVHLPDRWQQHLKTVYGAGTIARSMLHTTMQKDGVENFTFEMIEEVPKERLREREKYWIDFYQSKSYGMNERNG